MYKMNSQQLELKKLYNHLDKIKNAILGADYQTRIEMEQIKKRTIEKIKFIQNNKTNN